MANWKISKEIIELLEHPNADNLEIVKAGQRQFVVQKGMYFNGEIAISIPEKSLLPDSLAEPYLKYLAKNNRVKSCKLRKELSEGILLRLDALELVNYVTNEVLDAVQYTSVGEDISQLLDIKEYEPPIPLALAGKVKRSILPYFAHDCEHLSIYAKEFSNDDDVLVTEKIHSSLISVTMLLRDGLINTIEVTSKGLGKRQLCLEPTEANFYWKALENTGLHLKIASIYKDGLVQLVGEATPCQSGFNYDCTKPTIFVFLLIVNGQIISFKDIPDDIVTFWVPVLYQGKFDINLIKSLAQGNSTLADHIKEGVVVTPQEPRQASEGFNLALKFISDAYAKKATGEEFS